MDVVAYLPAAAGAKRLLGNGGTKPPEHRLPVPASPYARASAGIDVARHKEIPMSSSSRDTTVTLAGGVPTPKASLEGLTVGASGAGVAEVCGFLHRFGYLPQGQDTFDEEARAALLHYQRFIGVEPTGTVDGPTLRVMAAPRCGEPDPPPVTAAAEAGFTLNDNYPAWDDTRLTWKAVNYPLEWGPSEPVLRTIRHGFEAWSAHVPFIRLVHVGQGGNSDVAMSFAFRKHCLSGEFTSSNPLAHAPNEHRGQIHMNDAFTWIPDHSLPDSPGEANLFSVTAHEFGHVLGLGHSSNQDALMWPYVDFADKAPNSDDIAGVHAKYPLGGKTAGFLFYQQESGQWATGYPMAHGKKWGTWQVSEPGSFTDWTHIVGAGNQAMLFYNRPTGQFSTAILHDDGTVTTAFVSDPGTFGDWTHIAGAGNGALLFYYRPTGQFSTGILQPDGSFKTVFVSEPGAFAQWNRIVGSGNGALLFTNLSNGQWSTGILQADGSFKTVFVSEPGAFARWTHIAGAGNGALVFYNQDNGQWSTGILQADGSFDTVFVSEPGAFGHWTHIVGTGRGAFLFYDSPSGRWSTATLAPDGSFATVHVSERHELGTWSHLVCPTG
ncbi:matrixin family metalloprotease [Streptomyces sp. NPDC127108]|uniref:matrixin family metalloprotease n=1 Tax=Streptomyces sp. NPDC127108 TaxID=3345361 RepID=UPI00363E785C